VTPPRSLAKVSRRGSDVFAMTAKLRCCPACSTAPLSWSSSAVHEGHGPSSSGSSAVSPVTGPGGGVAWIAREHEVVDHEAGLFRLEQLGQLHIRRATVRTGATEGVVLRYRSARRQRSP
jgi:hypothetical protein